MEVEARFLMAGGYHEEDSERKKLRALEMSSCSPKCQSTADGQKLVQSQFGKGTVVENVFRFVFSSKNMSPILLVLLFSNSSGN